MPADVKANTKQQEIKDLVAYLTNVYKLPVKLEMYKKGVYFVNYQSILLDIPIILILFIKNRGDGFFFA